MCSQGKVRKLSIPWTKSPTLDLPGECCTGPKKNWGAGIWGSISGAVLTQTMTLGESCTNSVRLKNNSPNKSVPAPSPHYGGTTREEWVPLFKNRKVEELIECLRLVRAGSWGGDRTTLRPPACPSSPKLLRYFLKDISAKSCPCSWR